MREKRFINLLCFILGAVVCGAVIALCLYFTGFGGSSPAKEKQVKDLIHKNYIEDVSDETLEDGKYRGMLDSIGDKYASYFNTEEFKQLQQTTHSTEKGIGIYVYMDEETGDAVISGTIPGTPAASSGIAADDVILSVNGEAVEGKDLELITAMIKGSEDHVVLEIKRGEEILNFDIEMGEIPVDTVGYGMEEEDNIGYIYITKFGSNTPEEFREGYEAIMAEDPTGLIIDLRENLGGLVDSCTETLSLFVPEGLLVYTENKTGEVTEFRSYCTDPIDIPLVVLVNGNTASASEIFAGAVKDRRVGTIVGEQTYGKGIVQSIIPLSDGSAIRITTSSYFTPNGISLNGEGLKPDVEVENDDGSGKDRQFEKAVELIKEAKK